MLVNYAEKAVNQLMANVVEKIREQDAGACLCEICLEDVAASALNQLPPLYASSEPGDLVTESQLNELGGEQKIMAAIMNAAQIITKNPRHGIDRDIEDLVRDKAK